MAGFNRNPVVPGASTVFRRLCRSFSWSSRQRGLRASPVSNTRSAEHLIVSLAPLEHRGLPARNGSTGSYRDRASTTSMALFGFLPLNLNTNRDRLPREQDMNIYQAFI